MHPLVVRSKCSRAFATKKTPTTIVAFSHFLYKFSVIGLISEKHTQVLPVLHFTKHLICIPLS